MVGAEVSGEAAESGLGAELIFVNVNARGDEGRRVVLFQLPLFDLVQIALQLCEDAGVTQNQRDGHEQEDEDDQDGEALLGTRGLG